MIQVKKVVRNYLNELKTALDNIKPSDIEKVAEVLLQAYKNDKTVFIFGNGGSAATASHMACDLGKGTLKNVYDQSEKRLKVISLTDNIASMTAFANDLSFDDMFVQQLNNLVRSGDVVIGISGSGNTPNIIKALMYAKKQGAVTVGLLGYHKGGKAKSFVDYDITVDSDNYGVIEDVHLTLEHVLTTCLSYMKALMDKQVHLRSGKKTADRIKKQPRNSIAAEWIERSARR